MSTAWAVAAVVGIVIAVVGLLALRGRSPAAAGTTAAATDNRLGEVGEVLAALRSGAVVLDPADAVVQASPTAVALGLVRGPDLVHVELCQLARKVREEGVVREVETELPRTPGKPGLRVAARVVPLRRHHVLLLVEDRTQAQRLDAVRRDFVANVSHELKTPVGGIGLLAEAVLDAKDDPVAVERFARRISVESTRLSQLVQDIVDLSRLQASQTLIEPEVVAVSAVVREAVDQVQTLAVAKQMSIVVAEDDEAQVYGDADLLRTAVLNLLTNAVNYSGPGTRVAVGVRRLRHLVEVTVSDQGHGIPASEQERIFERFYRVDPARSRAPGGTGLGLAIVKHICSNHGGEVRVWSKVGQGSTFTVCLPAASVGRAAPTLPPTGDSVTAQSLSGDVTDGRPDRPGAARVTRPAEPGRSDDHELSPPLDDDHTQAEIPAGPAADPRQAGVSGEVSR